MSREVREVGGPAEPVYIRGMELSVDQLDALADAMAARTSAVQEFAVAAATALGDNTILAAPGAGQQYLVSKLQIQNESNTAVVVVVRWGNRTVWRVNLFTQGAGVVLDFDAPDRMEGRDNQPLILNLSAAVSVVCSVEYYVVAV